MKSVAVLLSTYNGERFLREQLDSIFAQKDVDVFVVASDDGSQDKTVDILKAYQEKFGSDRLAIRQGPRKGFAANFMSMVCDDSIQADYFAFSDQDDVWDEDKLARAVSMIAEVPAEKPALYCGRTRLINEAGQQIGFSPLFKRPPSFGNALVQSIAGGNTMLFNNAARNLFLSINLPVPSHDWLAYMLVSGAGGVMVYDAVPKVGYRQHGANLVGSNRGLKAAIVRIRKLLGDRLRNNSDLNVLVLRSAYSFLVADNQKIFDEFCKVRDGVMFVRCKAFFRSGIHRQATIQNIALFLSVLLKKV
jgi:glycosyltransferase involved in cell wall biosynthesis